MVSDFDLYLHTRIGKKKIENLQTVHEKTLQSEVSIYVARATNLSLLVL